MPLQIGTELRALLAGVGIARGRAAMSYRYLRRGEGLEIGALNAPLPLRRGVKRRIVDRRSRSQAIVDFPELDPALIPSTDLVEDGFQLSSLDDESVDFVIANHVLEHAPNPFGVLDAWARVVRPEGIIFLSVPIAENCFDAGRSLTTPEHLIDDYRLCASGQQRTFALRNREHYREWLTISRPRLFRDRGRPAPPTSGPEFEQELDRLCEQEAEIHFHTFSTASFEAALEIYCASIDESVEIVVCQTNPEHDEVIALLRRHSHRAAASR